MCGIVGIYNHNRPEAVDRAVLKRMNDALEHRGPNEEGLFVKGQIGLGIRRLSIIDLASGHQPMGSDDGAIQIVFNGEIYNFETLRQNLLERGHHFKTRSDTEVILRLYEEHGPDCVKYLRGMFAFAIWDENKNRLMLARDRIGKKPLVYSHVGGQLMWASEIQALAAVPCFSQEIRPEAIDLYLGLQYIPSPMTAFKNVQKLPPAHLMIVENGSVRIERYWDLPLEGTSSRMDFQEAQVVLREKLTEATRIRMIADVPLGGFLSGGMDSSVIVSLMSRLSSQPIKTFSIGFEEAEFSELNYAKEVSRHFGTDHTEFVVRANMTDVLPKLARHYGEPFGDSSALPSYYLARETRRHVTVALTGDGGDENFGGYDRYRAMMLMSFFQWIPKPLRSSVSWVSSLLPGTSSKNSLVRKAKRLLTDIAGASPQDWYLSLIGIFSEREKRDMYTPAFQNALTQARVAQASAYLGTAFKKAAPLDLINRLCAVDIFTYLPECLMAKVDIATMANSLEARSPLLDQDVVEFSSRLKGSWKLDGSFHSKKIFKSTFEKDLPQKISARRKMGFGLPIGHWFRGQLGNYWKTHVLSPVSLARNYFQVNFLQKLFDEHMSGRRDHGYRMWNLLMLELWSQSYHQGGKAI